MAPSDIDLQPLWENEDEEPENQADEREEPKNQEEEALVDRRPSRRRVRQTNNETVTTVDTSSTSTLTCPTRQSRLSQTALESNEQCYWRYL